MLPESFKKLKDAIDTDGDGNISEEELSNALKILTSARAKKQKETQRKIFEKFSSGM
jgi:Ca2+-binding EF-hand superfamily protein